MLNVEVRWADGRTERQQLPDECIVGRAARSELRLSSWRVGAEHARLFRTRAGVMVEDLGSFGGTEVNGQRLDGQQGPLGEGDVISVGPFRLRVLGAKGVVVSDDPASLGGSEQPTDAAPIHPVGIGPHANWPVPGLSNAAATSRAPTASEGVARSADATSVLPPPASSQPTLQSGSALPSTDVAWRRKVHAQLLQTIDLRRQDISAMSDEVLRAETGRLIAGIVAALDADLPAGLDRDGLCRQVLDEAVGLGPLEPLLADDSVTEVMVNRHDQIFVERAGRLERHPLVFTDDRAVLGVIERIVAPIGRRIDEASPMVDARLKDGSRVNAVIPPLALKGPCITIRKFARRKLDASDLVRYGSLSADMAAFLEVCVRSRKNIVVSGGTGSGKTTLLNILSNFIPAGERVITVEDAAELQLHHAHLISLESRPANVEGKGGVPIRDLVRNTLRMRPDRIVVGECRGAEALDMLQAMNTGHEGSLTTLHANTPRDALARLETMVLMAGMDLPLAAIREQIASAVDVIVQQTRFACGTRAVTSIAEVTGIESGRIQLQELFRFQVHGHGVGGGRVQGLFTGCDLVPEFYESLREAGEAVDLGIFKPAVAPRAAAVLA
jgi:pilus assembly protein CpaF